MTSFTSLQQQRRRVFALIEQKADKHTPTVFDYCLDDFCRDLLDLPERPAGALPYVGWMVGSKKNTPKKMKVSQPGVDLIKSHEGLRTKAYMCPANVLTIGYGHTSKVYPDQVISHQEAERLLKEDLKKFENAVNAFVKVPLSQNQFNALVSFTFNVGITAFANSTLLRFLNDGRYSNAASQFDRWVNGGGVQLPGLVRRRKEERELFLT